MRKLYTEFDLHRIGRDGSQSCFSRVVQTPGISTSPAITADTPLAAAPPPNYGSFAAHRQFNAVFSAADDDDVEEDFSAPTTEMRSSELPSAVAGSTRWRWNLWRRWTEWLRPDAVTLADSIDKYSRVGFPFVFVVLSTVYWAVYLQIRPAEFDDDFVIIDWLIHHLPRPSLSCLVDADRSPLTMFVPLVEEHEPRFIPYNWYSAAWQRNGWASHLVRFPVAPLMYNLIPALRLGR